MPTWVGPSWSCTGRPPNRYSGRWPTTSLSADHGPGLIITASNDAYVAADLAGPVAERLGVEELVLAGQGHWWMVSDPDTAADGLVAFWSSLD